MKSVVQMRSSAGLAGVKVKVVLVRRAWLVPISVDLLLEACTCVPPLRMLVKHECVRAMQLDAYQKSCHGTAVGKEHGSGVHDPMIPLLPPSYALARSYSRRMDTLHGLVQGCIARVAVAAPWRKQLPSTGCSDGFCGQQPACGATTAPTVVDATGSRFSCCAASDKAACLSSGLLHPGPRSSFLRR